MIPDGFAIGPMREDEISQLEDWSAREGWNPANGDLERVWAFDPAAFIALRKGDELVGGGSIVSYGGQFGFMGLFIVRPEYRGQGLGTALWHYRRDTLLQRLEPGAAIGMDGVYAMMPFYARGGFAPAYRHLRYQGIAAGTRDPAVIPLDPLDFSLIDRYDRRHFPAPRPALLAQWITGPGRHAVGVLEGGTLAGYGVARPCREGYKLGPVFADRTDIAGQIIDSLMADISGQPVQIDIPEPNPAAIDLVRQRGFTEVFCCGRMYLGPAPVQPLDRIFGITSLEFG